MVNEHTLTNSVIIPMVADMKYLFYLLFGSLSLFIASCGLYKAKKIADDLNSKHDQLLARAEQTDQELHQARKDYQAGKISAAEFRKYGEAHEKASMEYEKHADLMRAHRGEFSKTMEETKGDWGAAIRYSNVINDRGATKSQKQNAALDLIR